MHVEAHGREKGPCARAECLQAPMGRKWLTECVHMVHEWGTSAPPFLELYLVFPSGFYRHSYWFHYF